MMSPRTRAIRRQTPLAVMMALVLAIVPCCLRAAGADVPYMPDVTAQMSDPAFWYNKTGDPNAVLADLGQIDAMNDAILHEKATCMNDLASWEEGTFDGQQYAQALRQAAEEDAQYFYNTYYGRYFWDAAQGKGVYMATWEEARDKLYGPMIDNACDGDATTQMPLRFGICTTRTCVLAFPSNERVLDDENDPDFDLQYQTALRVGEPVIIKGESNDGRYYHVITSCASGWVAASEVAVCADKAEWLATWQFDPAQTLVVLDDKIYTEDSFYAPLVSHKQLSMGTYLKLATPEEYGDGKLLSSVNRSGYNCHVVWLPVRAGDGRCVRTLALISEHCKVSEGYLPLTYANLASVALNQLGDDYGWGGMLSSNDCSGYVRDVYKCFGLELARNTTWQEAEPVLSYSFAGMSDEQRANAVRALPLGSVLYFNGHEMIYLGEEGGKLYVMSSVSNVVLDGNKVRVRGGVINTLDVQRASGKTWLQDLTSANVPYLAPSADAAPASAGDPAAGSSSAWTRLAGANRYATMAAIVNEGLATSGRVVLASGESFPDALCASALAGSWDCPVVLTARDSLSPEARAEIERLSAGDVVIFGGEASVSAGVEAEVAAMGRHVERMAGADRAATSVLALRRLVAGGLASDTVVVATGATYADALSVGPWSWATKSPVVLLSGSALSDDAVAAIREGGFSKAVVVGGEGSVPASVEAQLAGLEVTRLAGADRYATSVAVAEFAASHGLAWSPVFVASGESFPDALAGALLAGVKGGALLLVREGDTAAVDAVAAHKSDIARGYVLGGEASVPASVASALEGAVR